MKCRRLNPRRTGILLGLLSLLLLLRKAAVPSAAGAETPLHLRVETLQVGSGGTATLATDEADVLPGKGAFLVKEVTLSSSAATRGTEKLSLRAEIRVGFASPGGVAVTIRSRVNLLATTGGIPLPKSEIRREISTVVGEGTSQLFEVYASPALGTKVILNLRWFAGGEETAAGGGPTRSKCGPAALGGEETAEGGGPTRPGFF